MAKLLKADIELMRDSTDLWQSGNTKALRQRLKVDGFLFLRGILQRETVLSARARVISHLHLEKAIILILLFVFIIPKKAVRPGTNVHEGAIAFDENHKLLVGWTIDAESGGVNNHDEPAEPWAVLGNSPEVTAVYKGMELRTFYETLFENDYQLASDCETHNLILHFPSVTWLRMLGRTDATAIHAVLVRACVREFVRPRK
jgi:hypothetical protein